MKSTERRRHLSLRCVRTLPPLRRRQPPGAALIGILLLLIVTGCANFKVPKQVSWWKKDKIQTGTPTKIVGIWAESMLHQQGRPTIRGFGGRIYFYGSKAEHPIKVEGTLVVYAFDESNRSADNAVPDRKYVFPPDQLAQRYSESTLGASYNVWLPWDKTGGPRKDISLIARFHPRLGDVIVSSQSRHLLPGRAPIVSAASAATSGPIDRPRQQSSGTARPVSYQAPADECVDLAAPDETQLRAHMTTTTISVPRRIDRPLAGAARSAGTHRNLTRRRSPRPTAETAPIRSGGSQSREPSQAHSTRSEPLPRPTRFGSDQHPAPAIQVPRQDAVGTRSEPSREAWPSAFRWSRSRRLRLPNHSRSGTGQVDPPPRR